MSKTIKIGLFGFGCVGQGLYHVLKNSKGFKADIVKIAMRNIETRLAKEGLQEQARLLLQVHDELVFEVPDAILKKVGALVKYEMEHVGELAVPLVVDCKAGPDWGDMALMKHEV